MPRPDASAARRSPAAGGGRRRAARRLAALAALALAPALGGGAAALAQSGKPPPLGAEQPPPPPTGQIPRWGGGGFAEPQAPVPPPSPRRATPPPPASADASGKPPPLPPGSGPFGGDPGDGGRRTRSSGTGFVVAPGRVMTNHHVIEGCSEMRVRTTGGTELPASVLASDPGRDLALLSVRGDAGPPLRFRSGPAVRRGEGVVTYGFPLAGLLSSGPTLTTGDVSALSGLRDNQQHYQISAPVQPGNSGGPLLDLAGNVVGVVTSKLNAQRVAQNTGDIPQNVNFAVKGGEAVDFLRSNGVQPGLAVSDAPQRNAAEVGEMVHPSVLFLRCLR